MADVTGWKLVQYIPALSVIVARIEADRLSD
jgi:hypothetical protein